jgi:para-aminobenzoate synthetase component 1
MIRRNISYFHIEDASSFYLKLLGWLNNRSIFSLFQGNGFRPLYGSFDTFAAADVIDSITQFEEDPFDAMKSFHDKHKDWMIGRLSYDLKNYVEKLYSRNTDRLESVEMAFFIPQTLVFLAKNKVRIETVNDPEIILKEIQESSYSISSSVAIEMQQDTTREKYIEHVKLIKDHIKNGDFYELNYCIEFYSNVNKIDPASLYYNLNRISPMPFSVFQGFNGDYILSASPERFLKMSGNQIIAQPIKGTIRKDPDPNLDKILVEQLQNSEKEIAENMMIMDLMRNDLAKSAIPGTVKVPELFKIYSFNHLHQMITTITAEKKAEIHFTDVIRNAFPMGSMTGAPKIEAMEMIEKFENSRRGNFSGAAGYVKPNGDFDFNVLIRSFFYNAPRNMLKWNAGSAITYDAVPEDEYNECMLKASTLMQALKNMAAYQN